MQERMEKVFLGEIRRASRYKREGKYGMAISVLSAARGTLEKTLNMCGNCSKRDMALYVYLFVAYQDALCRAKRQKDLDIAFDEAFEFFAGMKQEAPALLGRCYLSVMRFRHMVSQEEPKEIIMVELEKTGNLLDEAAQKDALDDSALWGEFFARTAAYAQRYALMENDSVNALFDKALLYLEVYTPEKGVRTLAFRYGIQSKICWGKAKCYMKRKDLIRSMKMVAFILQAGFLEAMYCFAASVEKHLHYIH